jgi:hypothetical protein
MGSESSMELTRITKLLLWLLSKRPDIDNIGVREADPMDYSLDPDLTIDELYGDLTPDEQRLLQLDYLQSCLENSISQDNPSDS